MGRGEVHYVWCDAAACLDGAAWGKADIGLPTFNGEGVAMALDAAGRPRLAYQMGDEGLGYAWCDGGCESALGWRSRTAEAMAAVSAEYPPGLPQHQGCPILTWLNGVRPSLALDPAGHPRLGYDAELWWGGSSPTIHCDIGVPVARITLFPQP